MMRRGKAVHLSLLAALMISLPFSTPLFASSMTFSPSAAQGDVAATVSSLTVGGGADSNMAAGWVGALTPTSQMSAMSATSATSATSAPAAGTVAPDSFSRKIALALTGLLLAWAVMGLADSPRSRITAPS